MQFEVKQREPAFEPITVTLTLETPEDLCSFLARLNVPISYLDEHNDYNKGSVDSISLYDLWDKLDDIAIQLKLKK